MAEGESMQGRVVLVTGANGGLGTSVTQAFLEAGATVVGTSRKSQGSEFRSSNFIAIAAEWSKPERAKRLVEQVVGRLGKRDIVVHTRGGLQGGQAVAETDDQTLQ